MTDMELAMTKTSSTHHFYVSSRSALRKAHEETVWSNEDELKLTLKLKIKLKLKSTFKFKQVRHPKQESFIHEFKPPDGSGELDHSR
jgi:hypothetical protein